MVTVVDARFAMRHLGEVASEEAGAVGEAVEQVAFADRVVGGDVNTPNPDEDLE